MPQATAVVATCSDKLGRGFAFAGALGHPADLAAGAMSRDDIAVHTKRIAELAADVSANPRMHAEL